MQATENKTKLRIVVIATIALAVMVIIGGAAYAFMQVGSDNQATETTQQPTGTKKEQKVVTQEQLDHGMSEVNTAVDQTKKAHSAAVSAANDTAKRVKVSE
ncbi:MAG: hypothetical protein WAS27_03970 [Candidatus Saccharimonadales bacterium]